MCLKMFHLCLGIGQALCIYIPSIYSSFIFSVTVSETRPVIMSSKKCIFKNDWCSTFRWVRKHSTDNNKAICVICNATLSLANKGVLMLRQHEASKKHGEAVKSVKSSMNLNIFATPSVPSASHASMSSTADLANSSTSSIVQTGSCSLDRYIEYTCTTEAEIRWCILGVQQNLSLRSLEAAVDLSTELHSDSQVKPKLGKDKARYIVTHGIAPVLSDQLLREVKKSPFCCILFDEALNKVSQRGQLDFHIRFWNEENMVETRFVSSHFLGHARASDICDALRKGCAALSAAKILQVSMDGPNVNLSALRQFKAERQSDLPGLIDFGTCSLHAVDGVLRAGFTDHGGVMTFLRNAYTVFKNIPSRRADYAEYSEVDDPPLPKKYCATRWVENVQAAERAIQALPHVVSYIRAMERNFSEPHSQSYREMKESALHPLFNAKLAFFLSVARDFQAFLVEFQTEAPMLPHLHNSLSTLLDSLLRRIVKPEVLHQNHNVAKRIRLPLDDTTLLEAKNVDVGFGAKAAIRSTLSNKDNPQEHQRLRTLVKEFRVESQQSLIKMTKKMSNLTPLSSTFVHGCSALDPTFICSTDVEKSLISQTLMILVELHWLDGDEADTVKRQYLKLCTTPAVVERLKSFKRGIDRLDKFLIEEFDAVNSAPMMKFLQITLCLSHGQADVERGFSANKDLLIENLKEESLVAQRVVKDHIRQKCDGDSRKFKVTKDVVLSVKNARRRYRQSLEDANKRKRVVESADSTQKRKAAERLADLEERRKAAKSVLHTIDSEMALLRK